MSNKNYNKMYNKPTAEVQEAIELEVATTTDVTTDTTVEVQTAIEGVAEPEVIVPIEEAVVVNCAKLNVRKDPSPNAAVVAVIKAGSDVVVCDSESFDDYYKICTAAGIEGYCVKEYLKLK